MCFSKQVMVSLEMYPKGHVALSSSGLFFLLLFFYSQSDWMVVHVLMSKFVFSRQKL
jgi:hypothetical protein